MKTAQQLRECADFEIHRQAFLRYNFPMLLFDSAGNILLANDAWHRLFEYDTDALVGQSIDILIPLHKLQQHNVFELDTTGKAVNPSITVDRELVISSGRQQAIPVELDLHRTLVDGQACAVVTARDMRQQKRYKSTLALAMEAAASGMIMTEENGTIVYVNKSAVEMFNYRPSELLGQSIEILLPESLRKAHAQHRNRFLRDRQVRPMAEALDVFALDKSGRQVPVDIALTPLTTSEGRRIVATILDLSELRKAQQTLDNKNRQLAAANKELMQFAYSASHDLKSPLLSIMGLLSICKEDLDNGDLQELRDNISRLSHITERSLKTVQAVLEIARSGETPANIMSINIAAEIDDIWEDLGGALDANARIETDYLHQKPVLLDRDRLKVILSNLISNALRYRDPEKPDVLVRIRTRDHFDKLCITVTDNGIGIEDKDQAVVFDMFRQLDSQRGEGNGLGLSLIKRHVDHMGGEIRLSSKPRVGSTFTLLFPSEGSDP